MGWKDQDTKMVKYRVDQRADREEKWAGTKEGQISDLISPIPSDDHHSYFQCLKMV